jgi:hypothetical protein
MASYLPKISSGLSHHHLQRLSWNTGLEAETNRRDVTRDAIYERHVINRLGFIQGQSKRPEDEYGVDIKRPVCTKARAAPSIFRPIQPESESNGLA